MSMSLAYLNEDDRAYGLAGMTISLASSNAIDRVAEVSIDTDGPMVTFGHEYYFMGSPSVSPKAGWDAMVNNFYLTASMVIANAMARSVVRMHEDIPDDVLHSILEQMIGDGKDYCELEPDEVESIYNRALRRNRQLFYNPRLHPAVEELARVISRRRKLSGLEIIDELHTLQLLF